MSTDEDQLRERMMEEETEAAIWEETTPSEEIRMLSQNYYLIKDRMLDNFIQKYCPELLPVFSHLNATSNIDGRTERLLRLRVKYVMDLAKLMWKKSETTINRVIAHEALQIRGIYAIADTRHGWKGGLFIMKGRVIRVEQPERQRRWPW